MDSRGVTYSSCIWQSPSKVLSLCPVSGDITRPGEGGGPPGQRSASPAGVPCGLEPPEEPQLLQGQEERGLRGEWSRRGRSGFAGGAGHGTPSMVTVAVWRVRAGPGA